MKIIICGSISMAKDIENVRDQLVATGHTVEVPEGVKHLKEWEGLNATIEEKADRKIKNDLIRGYYEKMKDYDVVLVVNPPKNGVEGYIGGNTFIEMAFAHILNKRLYVLNPLPELSYTSEMIAMQPVILNGDLSKITNIA